MKKIFVSTLILTAVVSAKAQMTPEAWIASMPDLPSITQIIAEDKAYRNPDNEDPEMPLKDFLEAVDGAMQNGGEVMGKVGGADMNQYKNKLYKEKVAGTNVTKGQMAHMSKSQQEKVAKQAVKGQLAQYGLSEADIKKMQSGKMSKAEQDALTNKVMKHMTGGMDMNDMKFMQGMTDKERVEFMQMSGLAESTTAKMKEDMKKSKVSQATAKRIMSAVEQMEFTCKRVSEHKDLSHVMDYGDSLWSRKYEPSIISMRAKFPPLAAKYEELWQKGAPKSQLQAVADKIHQIKMDIWECENKFYEEYVPLYQREVGGLLGYIKGTMMSAFRSWKAAYDQAYKETKETRFMLSEAQITQPVEYYASLLRAIASYNKNLKGQVFNEEKTDE